MPKFVEVKTEDWLTTTKDAARYRWLRDKSPGQFEHPIVVTQARAEYHMKYFGPLAYANLDKAIDAAIAKALGK